MDWTQVLAILAGPLCYLPKDRSIVTIAGIFYRFRESQLIQVARQTV